VLVLGFVADQLLNPYLLGLLLQPGHQVLAHPHPLRPEPPGGNVLPPVREAGAGLHIRQPELVQVKKNVVGVLLPQVVNNN